MFTHCSVWPFSTELRHEEQETEAHQSWEQQEESPQRYFSINQSTTFSRGPAQMLPACVSQPTAMDHPQTSFSYICPAALVGRDLQWDTLLPKRWITAITKVNKDNSTFSHSLWTKAVHFIPYRHGVHSA